LHITFITACLEPGRDGVGDYTRALARHCAQMGHECSLISLNDVGIVQLNDSDTVHELRLQGDLAWEEKLERAGEFLESKRPDWISLQFVLYGWSPRGLPTGLDRCLKKLIARHKLQIMLHELWIGNHKKASIKERIIGGAQRFCLLGLLSKLNPSVVHTSIPAYVDLLGDSGINSRKLPLFGNIPIEPEPDNKWLFTELERAGIAITAATRRQYCLAGMFGSIHPNWPPEPLLTRLRAKAKESGRRLIILSVGRMGPGSDLWRRLAETGGAGVAFLALGERSAGAISSYLQQIDFGIAGTPYAIIEKSGSTTAMLEHGCPVLVNWIDPHEIRREEHDPLLHCLTPTLDFTALKRRAPCSRLPSVTREFLESLSSIPLETSPHTYEEHPVHTASK
jgi:hypothetical protein